MSGVRQIGVNIIPLLLVAVVHFLRFRCLGRTIFDVDFCDSFTKRWILTNYTFDIVTCYENPFSITAPPKALSMLSFGRLICRIHRYCAWKRPQIAVKLLPHRINKQINKNLTAQFARVCARLHRHRHHCTRAIKRNSHNNKREKARLEPCENHFTSFEKSVYMVCVGMCVSPKLSGVSSSCVVFVHLSLFLHRFLYIIIRVIETSIIIPFALWLPFSFVCATSNMYKLTNKFLETATAMPRNTKINCVWDTWKCVSVRMQDRSKQRNLAPEENQ